MKFATCVLVSTLLVSSSAPSFADDRARARAAFRAGSQHYNLSEFSQALDSFREAYRNYEDPSFLFNIAQCERQLGRKRDAIRTYRAYLNNAERTDNRESVRQTIAQLEREVAAEDAARAKAAATATATPTAAVTPPPPQPSVPAAAMPAEAATVTTTAPVDKKPAYKKWWVWTIVGGVVVAGAGAGLAVALTRSNTPTATTTLGTAHPSF